MLKVTNLPPSFTEGDFRSWLGAKLPDELLGSVYYVAHEESTTSSWSTSSCYVSFITYKTMLDAKSYISKCSFGDHKLKCTLPDVTRNDLISTTLKMTAADEVPPLAFYLGKSDVVINLACMVCVWLITVFDFYLISFLVNTFDQIFMSAIAAAVSELFAQAIGGYAYERVGVRTSMCVSYAMAAVGGFVMLFYGLQH